MECFVNKKGGKVTCGSRRAVKFGQNEMIRWPT